MIARWRMALVLVLALLNALVSGLLLLQHHGLGTGGAVVSAVCGDGADSGCATVARSAYAVAAGVPLAAWGLAFALSLSLLIFLSLLAGPGARNASAALAVVVLGMALVADIVLFGLQLFVIKAFCKLCLLTYALNAASFILLFKTRRDRAVVGEAWSGAEGRVAFAGWALGSVAVLAAVLAGDRALQARENAGAGAMLGLGASPVPGPAPATSPLAGGAPLAPGTEAQRYQEEARAAQEQARRLQEILDDPQKLDQYMAEKAAREFEQGAVQAIDLKTAPAKGPGQAPIRVVEYSDFLCPFCRSLAMAFNQYIPQSGNRVILYFKNYPLDAACNPNSRTVHPGACTLAYGAVCAQEQGKFWPYHDRVFANTLANPQPKDVVALATSVGLDAAAFETCLASPQAKDRVAAEIAEGHKGRVEGTPTLFINGKRLPRLNDFTQTVDREAKRLGLPPLPSPAAPAAAH
jgi:protein-disulfide isomerase/uncharacterized membrane protein